MLIYGMVPNRESRNWIVYLHQNYLHGELPIHICYSYPHAKFLAIVYCIYQRAYVWFEYIHNARQTFAMLAQLHYQETLPFNNSTQDSCDQNYSTKAKDVNSVIRRVSIDGN